MKNMKRFCALLMAAALTVGTFPGAAFAVGEEFSAPKGSGRVVAASEPKARKPKDSG